MTNTHMNLSDLEMECARAGLKMTGPRKTILKVLADSQDHPSVEELYERAKEIDSSVSMATVYRTMNLLVELEIVVKHEFNETYARYELSGHHHHHLIDLETGKVIEFENEELERIKEKIADELGYELVDHNLELYGKKKSK